MADGKEETSPHVNRQAQKEYDLLRVNLRMDDTVLCLKLQKIEDNRCYSADNLKWIKTYIRDMFMEDKVGRLSSSSAFQMACIAFHFKHVKDMGYAL